MRPFFSDVSYSAISQIFSALTILSIQIFTALCVSIEEYGKYAAVQAMVTIVEALFIARGGEIALQYIGKYWNRHPEMANHYKIRLNLLETRLNLSIYILFLVLGYLFSSLLIFPLEWLMILALTIPLQITYGVSKSVFIADHQLRLLAYVEISYSILLLLLALPLTRSFGIPGLLYSFVLVTGFKTILSHLVAKTFWSTQVCAPGEQKAEEGPFLSFLGSNSHSIIRNALINGATQGDLLIISMLQGSHAAGIYKVAKTIASIPAKGVAPAWAALRPRILRGFRERDFSRIRNYLVIPAGGMALFGILAFIPVSFYGVELIELSFGASYKDAAVPALYLLLGTYILGALTGWLRFTCVIVPRKLPGTLVYFLWFAGVIFGGWFYGKESALAMAMVSAASMAMASLVAWACYLRRGFWFEANLQNKASTE